MQNRWRSAILALTSFTIKAPQTPSYCRYSTIFMPSLGTSAHTQGQLSVIKCVCCTFPQVLMSTGMKIKKITKNIIVMSLILWPGVLQKHQSSCSVWWLNCSQWLVESGIFVELVKHLFLSQSNGNDLRLNLLLQHLTHDPLKAHYCCWTLKNKAQGAGYCQDAQCYEVILFKKGAQTNW